MRSAWQWTASFGAEPQAASTLNPFQKMAAKPKEFPPAPWVPWSLLSTGAVVCLYSFTIPKRMGGGK